MKTADIEVTLLDAMGTDLSVVDAARVSFDKESEWEVADPERPWDEYNLSERDKKLIKYLADHKHTSPFNHCFVSFRVKAPIFVARQLVKHKFLPWNEVSRRYVDSEPEFFFPDYWRAKAENVKQGSSNDRCEAMYEEVEEGWIDPSINEWVQILGKDTLSLYQSMLKAGCCAEQARMVLPQNTMTEWIWSGSLGAFADMCRLRLDPHAQKESRDVAVKIAEHLKELFPVSFNALIA